MRRSSVAPLARWRDRADEPRAPGRPGTSDRLYDADEAEFLAAVDRLKRESGRQFPAMTDLLGVLKSLGWRKGPAGAGEG